MCHIPFCNPTFISALIDFDAREASELRLKGCSDPDCPGKLHVANYKRKPKGVGGERIPGLDHRFSFCCSEQGCRKRHTPASVCFLGQRVYLGVVVVLASALEQGLTAFREKQLAELNISRQVLHAWITWWRAVFSESSLWKTLKASFISVPIQLIPLDPMSAMAGETFSDQLTAWLKHLKPISITPLMRSRVEKITQSF